MRLTESREQAPHSVAVQDLWPRGEVSGHLEVTPSGCGWSVGLLSVPEGVLALEPEGPGAPVHPCPIHPAPPSGHSACLETCQELALAASGLASSCPPERRLFPLVHSGLTWSVSTEAKLRAEGSGDLLKGDMCIRSWAWPLERTPPVAAAVPLPVPAPGGLSWGSCWLAVSQCPRLAVRAWLPSPRSSHGAGGTHRPRPFNDFSCVLRPPLGFVRLQDLLGWGTGWTSCYYRVSFISAPILFLHDLVVCGQTESCC